MIQTEVVVFGSGPGGYTAAFRAADLGKKVVLIERYDSIGGVCLNVGCIPSKALLHAAKVIDEAQKCLITEYNSANPKSKLENYVDWKNSVVTKLTGGLKMLAKQRKVEIVHGVGKFISDHEIEVCKKMARKKRLISAGNYCSWITSSEIAIFAR